MPAETKPKTISRSRFWTGWIITGLVVIFLLFDGVTKVIETEPVVRASKQLGLPESTVIGIGLTLLICTALYALPRTAVLGALLLTGYLGGAILAHVRAENGAFPVIFSAAVAILAWVGLVIREPGLLRLILMRQWPGDLTAASAGREE